MKVMKLRAVAALLVVADATSFAVWKLVEAAGHAEWNDARPGLHAHCMTGNK